jgi:FtsH-binding integral membrane protein
MPYATSSLYKTFFGGLKKGGNMVLGSDMVIMGGSKASNFIQLLNDKKEFLILVLSNLIVQLGITYYVMMNYQGDTSAMSSLMLFLAQLLIIFVLAFIPMPSFLKFILFVVFSVTFGVLLASLKKKVDIKIIQTAIVGTVGIFVSMILAGLGLVFLGVKLGYRFGLALFYALLLLIVTTIVFKLMGTYSTIIKALNIIGLLLFSLFLVYDTNQILQRNYYGDFITASMDYYLDIINIFINLVNLENR